MNIILYHKICDKIYMYYDKFVGIINFTEIGDLNFKN